MGAPDPPRDDPSIYTVLEILWRRRRVVIGAVLLFTILTALLSLAMPRTYQARTTLLPPVENTPSLIGLGDMPGAMGFFGLPDKSTASTQLFQQILQSRTVTEAVVREVRALEWLELTDRPERAAMELAVLMIQQRCQFSLLDAGMLEITARSSTGWFAGGEEDEEVRQRVAELARAYVEQLDRVNREMSLSRAKHIRVYLEGQLRENQGVVQRLGEELTRFREEHGAVALDAQTKALVETAAAIKGQLLEKEVQLGIALQTMTEENPVARGLRDEIAQLRESLAGLEGAKLEAVGGGEAPSMELPAAEIPVLQYELASYEHELEAQLQLQAYIREQYYQAKIEEARDTPTVQILDPAVAPEERTTPKRKVMVIGAVFAGLLFGVIAAGGMEWVAQRRAA